MCVSSITDTCHCTYKPIYTHIYVYVYIGISKNNSRKRAKTQQRVIEVVYYIYTHTSNDWLLGHCISLSSHSQTLSVSIIKCVPEHDISGLKVQRLGT